MNHSRDPFNIRRTSPASALFRNNASASSQAVNTAGYYVETAQERASQPIAAFDDSSTMSSYGIGLPNGGSAAATNVDTWQSSGRSRFTQNSQEEPGLGEKMSNMFSGGRRESLPMYKDKPYDYPRGKGIMRRLPPWARRKRVFGPALVGLAIISWWFGILSPLSYFSGASKNAAASVTKPKPKSKWNFPLGSLNQEVDWQDRAERVKEAFRISFSGYEKYGWGMSRVYARRGSCG